MTTQPTDRPMDDAALARQLIDTSRFLVLATAGAGGDPWPAPVWYARAGREFIWVSRPQTRHSRNLEARSTVGFVIFEMHDPIEERARAVYAEATAAEVSEADRDRCVGIFDRRSCAEGLGSWTTERVVAPAELRLYHAIVSRFFTLEPDRDIRREIEIDL